MSETCERCGKPLAPSKTKKRLYCGEACRKRYEREHKKLLSTAEGRALHAEWQELRFNRLAIHYLTRVYDKYGATEAKLATQYLFLLLAGHDKAGLDLK